MKQCSESALSRVTSSCFAVLLSLLPGRQPPAHAPAMRALATRCAPGMARREKNGRAFEERQDARTHAAVSAASKASRLSLSHARHSHTRPNRPLEAPAQVSCSSRCTPGVARRRPVPPPLAPRRARAAAAMPSSAEAQPAPSTSASTNTPKHAAAMAAYAALKDRLARRSRKAGAGLAAYLFLTVSGEAAAAALVGTAASALYLTLLFRDADALNLDSRVPLMAAQAETDPWLRKIKVVGAAYWHALANPRLAVVVGLAGAVAAGGALTGRAPGDPPLLEAGCLLLGFLSYKIALVLELWDDLKPKIDPEAGLRPPRPTIVDLRGPKEDEEEVAEEAVEEAEVDGGGVGDLIRSAWKAPRGPRLGGPGGGP